MNIHLKGLIHFGGKMAANQYNKVKLYIKNEEDFINNDLITKELTKTVSEFLKLKLPDNITSLDILIKDIIQTF